MNILFVMYDQLRFDYLGCAGHPRLKTPNFDRLARMGVRFTNAYCQSPICGPSRMSTYTGRYPSSHGAQQNRWPLRIGEPTLGDHLREAGMDSWLIGKTHMNADSAGMARLGIDPESVIGRRQAECGFDVWARDDGLWARGPRGWYDPGSSPYNAYLASKGYDGDNPWADYANAGIDEAGDIASGWFLKNAARPANIREEDSETPWLTGEAIRFMEQAQGRWMAHVSYIKPHWPYIVPAPYHAMFGPEDVPPPVRSEAELENMHPVFQAFTRGPVGRAFQRDDVRNAVIPAYMGLIRQADDQFGRLLGWLEERGRLQDTMIVLTSDHGDYLGDHWMGEKNLFHDPSAKIPLIIYDPRSSADATRGTTCGALVESIDLAATFIEAAGGDVPRHIVEGRSLLPWLRGEVPGDWRKAAISEYTYSNAPFSARLGVAPQDARLFMAFDGRFKLVHDNGTGRPMLFDLHSDPQELDDLARRPGAGGALERMYAHLHDWARRDAQRLTRTDAQIAAGRGRSGDVGIFMHLWDGSEVPSEQTALYRGPARQNHLKGGGD